MQPNRSTPLASPSRSADFAAMIVARVLPTLLLALLAVAQSGGCAGMGTVPMLSAKTQPWIGDNHVLEALGTTAGAFDMLAFALTPTPVSLAPFGFPLCTAEINPLGSLCMPVNPASGRPEAGIMLPNDPSFTGLVIHWQFVSLEPSGQLAMSGRGDSTLGLR